MKAGKTNLDVNTRVRITHIASDDPDDRKLVGVVGEITHPFPGHMSGDTDDYVAGLWVEDEVARKFGLGSSPLGGSSFNLVKGDTFEVIEAGDEEPAGVAGPALSWMTFTPKS